MFLEKEQDGIKWFKDNELKFKVVERGQESIIFVMLDGYNICLQLLMYEFVKHIQEDILLNVSISRDENKQRILITDTKNVLEVISYIIIFINEWNISITDSMASTNKVSDELWYNLV